MKQRKIDLIMNRNHHTQKNLESLLKGKIHLKKDALRPGNEIVQIVTTRRSKRKDKKLTSNYGISTVKKIH